METKYDVLVVGDINPDLMMVDYNRLPDPGEETHVKAAYVALGGGCAICASGLAKLGLNVAVYGFIGNDSFGKMMLETLEEVGISTEHVTVEKNIGTGISVAFTNSKDRAFLTYEGANALFDVDNIPDEVINSAKHIHVLCYAPAKHEKYVNFFKRIKGLNKTASFDLGYDDTEEWSKKILEIVELVDIFMPNEKEATNYTRKETPEEALIEFAKVGNTVVIKKGAEGSIAHRDGEYAEANPFKATCVDTTGAGDSFNSGFIFGWLKKYDLKECLLIGNAVGSKSVENYGGNTGVPYYEDIKELLYEENIEI